MQYIIKLSINNHCLLILRVKYMVGIIQILLHVIVYLYKFLKNIKIKENYYL